MKKIIFLLTLGLSVSLLRFTSSIVEAQGNCSVESRRAAPPNCKLKTDNCDDGYYPVIKFTTGSLTGNLCWCECTPVGTTPTVAPGTGTVDVNGNVTWNNYSVSGFKPAPCIYNGVSGVGTALGCIPTQDTGEFVVWILRLAIGIGGGIAFLLMILGGIKMITSAGNPEGVKAGQELISSALMGLIFIIFSLFLLQLIGVKIFQIPGFGE